MMKEALLAAAIFSLTHGAVAADFLADRHAKVGVTCESCHGPDQKNLEMPTLDTCTGCHNLAALTEKTAKLKPTNPHISPHYQDQLDCTNCHMGHAEGVNFCNQCHQFDFKVR